MRHRTTVYLRQLTQTGRERKYVATAVLEVGLNILAVKSIVIFDMSRPEASIKRTRPLEDQELGDRCINEIVRIVYIPFPYHDFFTSSNQSI